MKHDHPLSALIQSRRLVEVRLTALDGDPVLDAYFADAQGDRLHLCFLGAAEIELERFEAGAHGYRLRAEGAGGVRLVPPRRRGLSLVARAVMSVD